VKVKQLKRPGILLDFEQDGGYGHQVLVEGRAAVDPLDTLGEPASVALEISIPHRKLLKDVITS